MGVTATRRRLVLALQLLLGCAAPPPEHGHGPTPPPSASSGPALPPPSEEVALLVSQLAEAHDYRRWAAGLPSLGVWERDAPRPRSGAFIFLRRFDRSTRFPLSQGMAGVGAVFHGDGSLSPSVVLPAYAIRDADLASLAELMSAPSAEGWPSFDRAHHVFVTFSSEGRREVAVSFEGQRWYGEGLQGTQPDAAVLDGLRTICRRSGAPLCDLHADAATEARTRWWAEERERTLHGTWRRGSRPLPIDGERSQAALSARERGLACVWNLEHVDTLFEPRPDPFEMVGGFRVRLLPWARCVATFPTCDVPLKELAPCMEVAQRGDLWLRLTETGRQCLAKRACLWGFAWDDGAAPRSQPVPPAR